MVVRLCFCPAGTFSAKDLGTPESGPKQVCLPQYPLSQFGSQQRAFNNSWFEQFNCLEYSVATNSTFCFPCWLYGRQHIRNNKDALLSGSGFSNWKRALESYHEHEKSAFHMSSMACWQSYKSTQTHGDVFDQLKVASAAEISERRQYLGRVVGVTTFLGKQGISFRGHDEQDASRNPGNFLECMKLLKKFDPFLQKYNPPSNATYLSHSTKNEIINSISQQITENITEQVKACKVYSVSGAVGGVQAHFKERHPEAVYVHCYAHHIENMYTFFSSSLINHNKFIEIQNQLGLKQSELVQLSTTRWASQVRSVRAVLTNFLAIIECLSTTKTAMAQGIWSKLCKQKTVYLLVMFDKLLGVTEGLPWSVLGLVNFNKKMWINLMSWLTPLCQQAFSFLIVHLPVHPCSIPAIQFRYTEQ